VQKFVCAVLQQAFNLGVAMFFGQFGGDVPVVEEDAAIDCLFVLS